MCECRVRMRFVYVVVRELFDDSVYVSCVFSGAVVVCVFVCVRMVVCLCVSVW